MIVLFVHMVLAFGLSWEYKSVRSLALGGVGAAIRDPQTSFFFNPAGMRGVSSFDILSFEIHFSESLISEIPFLQERIRALPSEGGLSLSEGRDLLGKRYGLGVMYFPHFVASVGSVSFGLGVLSMFSFGFEGVLPSNVSLSDVFLWAGVLPVFGGGFSLLQGSLDVGVSVVPLEVSTVSRFDVRQNEFFALDKFFPAVARGQRILQDLAEARCYYPLECAFGFGGLNLGLIWNPIWFEGFSVGLDLRDVFDPLRKMTADFGVSYRGKFRRVVYSFFFDFQDLIFSQSGNSDPLKHVFFGTEVAFSALSTERFLSLMFGVGQMNLSAGLEINLKVISFTVGTFGWELGRYVGGSNVRYYFFKLAI